MTYNPELRQPTLIKSEPPGVMLFIPSVLDFFDALNGRDIRYCHWKSNIRLDWGLDGRTDLDLLVDPAHKDLFEQTLAEYNIKPLRAPVEKRYPGLEHYLGFDSQTGRLFHLHVHYRLVLGEQHIKNYILPLEEQFLDAPRFSYGVKIPSAELELIVLSMRALLKYRDRDVIKDILSIRTPGIPDYIYDEIIWLMDQTSIEQVRLTLLSLPLEIDPDIILEFLRIMQEAPRAGYELFRLRSRLRRMLRPYQRRNRFLASLNYYRQIARKMFIRRSAQERQLALPTGGLMIALVGVDGSGKSTHCAELTKWMSWKIDTHFFYLGSKQPSPWTTWSYTLFRMARRSHRELSARWTEEHILTRWLVNARQVFLALHYYFVGRDRFARFQRAKQAVESGSVVIFDRFPFEAPLDGPEIHLINDGFINTVSRSLSRAEKALYRKFNPVDLLILLDVNLETSLQRKPDHSLETIRAKNAALNVVKSRLSKESDRWNWVSVETDAPFDDVLLHIKKLIWAAL